ncbi:MAG: MoaD/ThiS family protein, partial [Anaerolineae bacterium]|nr:MoaD/ThiS family protein [Anaerolineae bacterium]
AAVDLALRKFFNYFPQARAEALDIRWDEREQLDATGTPWLTVEKVYRVKEHPAWRVLLNGRDLRWIGGPGVTLSDGDEISIYSPGR